MCEISFPLIIYNNLNLTGSETHFKVVIVSEAFEGLALIKVISLGYTSFGNKMPLRTLFILGTWPLHNIMCYVYSEKKIITVALLFTTQLLSPALHTQILSESC